MTHTGEAMKAAQTMELADDVEKLLRVAKSANQKREPMVVWDHDVTTLENVIAALRGVGGNARETEHRDALLAALSALNNPLNVSLRDRAFDAINRALYTLPRPHQSPQESEQ